uniref:RNA-directed RNA polymerase n=1 Tax=Leviviridae sp. TaxID=2027243 RepID=A0A514DC23_9VIRU|nr:MAG: RNA-dependent RNA polymerase [Leviviridae sp.]
MKSLMQLAREILTDVGIWCHVSTSRDYKTISTRFENEGLSFLTITLPKFCDDFQICLDQELCDPSLFSGFTKRKSTPEFLGGLLDLIFERDSGRLLEVPSIDAIRAIRQICLAFGKINLPCSDARVDSAIIKYLECEKDVRKYERTFPSKRKAFMRMSMLLWAQLLSNCDKAVYTKSVYPKHGPGATADKLVGNNKWNQFEWPARLEREFPMAEYAFSSYSEYLACEPSISILEPGAERPVRVITVPKTLKTPRIIAIEPTCMQYTQQAILQCLVAEIERDDNAFNFVRFISQEPNQTLAKEGSLDSSLATLDLSEASDRVSNQHVRALLSRYGSLFRAVDACRSRKADVPGHSVIRLSKFASMGSALCFPFEALTFCTVIFLGIQNALNRPLTKKDIKSFYGRVRVYGDDIIIPVEYVDPVVTELESFGFVVNRNKSFWNGKFRESCGKEFYAGHDVSITRVRQPLPLHRGDAQEIASTVSLRNHFYLSGYWSTARYLDNLLRKLIPFPNGLETSPGLVRTCSLGYASEREHPTLHKPLVKVMVVVPTKRKSPLEGSGALAKCLMPGRFEPFDKDHLQFAGRPTAVDIKRRWSTPY